MNYSEVARKAMNDISPFPGFQPRGDRQSGEEPGKKKVLFETNQSFFLYELLMSFYEASTCGRDPTFRLRLAP